MQTAFLYDSRGGRDGCALEAIEFQTPALKRDRRAEPTRPGIRAALMWVADLEAAVSALRDAGATVGEPVDGLISGTKSVLAVDTDRVVVELAQCPPDVDASDGRTVLGNPDRDDRRGGHGGVLDRHRFRRGRGADDRTGLRGSARARWLRGVRRVRGRPVRATRGRPPLHADRGRSIPDTAADVPVPWGGNHQGLYRCALRVESVDKALAALPDSVEVRGDPVWCPLPGTKIEGLYIAFLRSPDGVVFEFVERPLTFFSR